MTSLIVTKRAHSRLSLWLSMGQVFGSHHLLLNGGWNQMLCSQSSLYVVRRLLLALNKFKVTLTSQSILWLQAEWCFVALVLASANRNYIPQVMHCVEKNGNMLFEKRKNANNFELKEKQQIWILSGFCGRCGRRPLQSHHKNTKSESALQQQSVAK